MPVAELEIAVSDVQDVVILYDRLELFRSPTQDGVPTPFSPITALTPTSAILDGTVGGPWNLNGQTMNIVVDGAPPVTVSFSGTNPFLLVTVRNAINAAFPSLPSLLASEVLTDTNRIRLTSPTSGTGSILQVSGTAASILGLLTDRANGKSACPLLSANTEIYVITDFDGQPTYWYKVRYLNSATNAVSGFSDAFLASGGVALTESFLSIGKIALSDVGGNPVKGRRIIFIPTSSQVIADGSGHNYGVLPSVDRIVVTTDDNGRASISLVKGQRLKVFIEGTTFQREFVVPSTDFDILTVASAQPDPLSIVVAAPLAVRVSE
jgi:hypothetical protein